METQKLLTQSNTDWTVSKRPLFDADGNPTNGYGIFRDDTDKCLGLVGSKYTITQNSEVVDMLLEAADQVDIPAVRGGYLGEGQRVYYQFSLPDVEIGKSNTKRYLTGLTAHDGLTKIGFGATNVVVVCQNTFFQAFQDCEAVKHTPNHKEKLAGIIKSLKLSLFQEEAMVDDLIKLSRVTVPTKVTDEFLISIIGGMVDAPRTQNRLSDLRQAIGTEYSTHGENAYALFNGITRFTNHMMNYKDIDAKRKALMFGSAAKINENGLTIIKNTFLPTVSAGISI